MKRLRRNKFHCQRSLSRRRRRVAAGLLLRSTASSSAPTAPSPKVSRWRDGSGKSAGRLFLAADRSCQPMAALQIRSQTLSIRRHSIISPRHRIDSRAIVDCLWVAVFAYLLCWFIDAFLLPARHERSDSRWENGSRWRNKVDDFLVPLDQSSIGSTESVGRRRRHRGEDVAFWRRRRTPAAAVSTSAPEPKETQQQQKRCALPKATDGASKRDAAEAAGNDRAMNVPTPTNPPPPPPPRRRRRRRRRPSAAARMLRMSRIDSAPPSVFFVRKGQRAEGPKCFHWWERWPTPARHSLVWWIRVALKPPVVRHSIHEKPLYYKIFSPE